MNEIKVGDEFTLSENVRSLDGARDGGLQLPYATGMPLPAMRGDEDDDGHEIRLQLTYEIAAITQIEEGTFYRVCDTEGYGYEGWLGNLDDVRFRGG